MLGVLSLPLFCFKLTRRKMKMVIKAGDVKTIRAVTQGLIIGVVSSATFSATDLGAGVFNFSLALVSICALVEIL